MQLEYSFEDRFHHYSQFAGISIEPIKSRILLCLTSKHRIWVFDMACKFITSFGEYGYKKGQFCNPTALCTIRERIFVCDCGNERIQVFNLAYTFVSVVHTTGFNPKSICSSKEDKLLVGTSQGVVLILNPTGAILSKFGVPGSEKQGMKTLDGICCDSLGQIIVSDTWNDRVHILDSSGQVLSTITSSLGNPAYLHFPCGICVNRENSIMVVNGNQITIFDANGNLLEHIPMGDAPLGILLLIYVSMATKLLYRLNALFESIRLFHQIDSWFKKKRE